MVTLIIILSQMMESYPSIDDIRVIIGQDDPMFILASNSIDKINDRWNTGLMVDGTRCGPFIGLRRVRPGMCPISGEVHASGDGYMIITSSKEVFYGCNNKCATMHGSHVQEMIRSKL